MRLSFRNGLVLFAVLVPLLAAATVFSVALVASYDQLSDQVSEALAEDARQTARPLRDATLHVRDHARTLASAVATLYATVPDDPDSAVAQLLRREIFSETFYDQLRFIGPPDDARERIRFNRVAGHIVRVTPAMLQAKGHRDYYQAAAALPMGQVALNVTLNREFGGVMEDRPMLRAATPVYRADELIGVLVINVDFRALVRELESSHAPGGTRLYIAEPTGYWLAHPDPHRTFGFEREGGGRVSEEFPQLSAALEGMEPGQTRVSRTRDGWFSVYRMALGAGEPASLDIMLVRGDIDADAAVLSAMVRSAGVTLPLMLLAGLIAVVLRRRFVEPLVTIAGWAERVERGDYDLGALPQGDRAVREFADKFSAMAALLGRRERDLLRRNAELEEFAYVAAHDLKAPLRAAANLALVIDEDAGESLDETSRGHLRTLRERVRGMHELIDGLLAYGRLGSDEPHCEEVALEPLLGEVVASLKWPQGFRVEWAAPLPILVADPTHLRRIFENLLGNAILHHDRAVGHVRIRAEERANHWLLEVADDGPGIPEHRRAQLFRMFSNGGVSGHLGIGLAIVRKLVLVAGGRIEVADSQPRGTVFRIHWPKSAPSAA